jgi:hypothetical protein
MYCVNMLLLLLPLSWLNIREGENLKILLFCGIFLAHHHQHQWRVRTLA